jgi:hypothetical protein
MHRFIEQYEQLKIPKEYFGLICTLRDKRPSEYTQITSFLSGTNKILIKDEAISSVDSIQTSIGDFRIDVPVWFGKFDNARFKVCVVGSEPRDTSSSFNIARVGNRIFASPFGADRWNCHSTIARRPQLKYFRALERLLCHPKVFLLLTDVIKEYSVVSLNKSHNDRYARQQFPRLIDKWRDFLTLELEIVKPDIIIAFGNTANQALMKVGLPKSDIIKVRHPSYGGERVAKEQIECIIKNQIGERLKETIYPGV